MTFGIDTLVSKCADFGLELDSAACERLQIYSDLLIEWNGRMNLTSITDPSDIMLKHFYDSLLFFKYVDVKRGASLIDVGTGAGFPGLVLKIARPDISVTLLDSLNKRLTFLSFVLDETGLDADIIHMRAEEGSKGEMRESFDIAAARAVASMPVLSELCLPYVKVGGVFAALKGSKGLGEAALGETAATALGGSKPECLTYKLPNGDGRTVINVKKISQTPTNYPRKNAEITRKPL